MNEIIEQTIKKNYISIVNIDNDLFPFDENDDIEEIRNKFIHDNINLLEANMELCNSSIGNSFLEMIIYPGIKN